MTVEIIEKLKRKEMLHKAKVYFDSMLEFTRGPVELHHMIERGEKLNIIDVRRHEDYVKEHIPGAVSLPEDQWSTFKGLSKDRPNVVYCYSVVCQISKRAAKYFAEHDFPVLDLSGGIEEWKKNHFPTESYTGNPRAS
jgi:rhodanese-related sulfurtransferase